MGLSIAQLKAGQERIHIVALRNLDGESLYIREIPQIRLEGILSDRIGGNLTESAILKLISATVTDETSALMTEEDAKVILEAQQGTILQEIIERITQVHQGSVSEGND
jgi:hypothetical protein